MFKQKVLSDKELIERLTGMGLMRDEQTVDDEVMSVFAGIYAGLYIWDFKHSAVFRKDGLTEMQEAFNDLAKEGDYQGMYLMLALRYDQIMKPLPDPIWWLMCSPEAVEGFMLHFSKHFNIAVIKETGKETQA